jgi:hypothetical protein
MSMLCDSTALNSAVSEVYGIACRVGTLAEVGPPYFGFGAMVYAPVVLLNEVSRYGPFTTCHSGFVA